MTVDTAPDGGSIVHDYVARPTDVHAPPKAREVMAQLVVVTSATGGPRAGRGLQQGLQLCTGVSRSR